MNLPPVRPPRRPTFAWPAPLGLMLALVAAGCGDQPPATAPETSVGALARLAAPSPPWLPTPPASRGAYPLAVGNRWHSEYTERTAITDSAGNVHRGLTYVYDIEREIVGTGYGFNGLPYFEQLESWRDRETQELARALRLLLRQDALGLYETQFARAAGSEAAPAAASRLVERNPLAARSPAHLRKLAALELIRSGVREGAAAWGDAGPMPDEFVRLRYPLRLWSRWVVYDFDGTPLRAIVVARRPVRLPEGPEPAWHVQYDWQRVYGPRDRVVLWYGDRGLLGMQAHLESEATDEFGNPIGTVTTEVLEVLRSAELVTP